MAPRLVSGRTHVVKFKKNESIEHLLTESFCMNFVAYVYVLKFVLMLR